MARLGRGLGSPRCFLPVVTVFRHLCEGTMQDMGVALSRSPLERLPFDNQALKRLPLDPCEDEGVRQVKGACFSRVKPQPLTSPRFVAVSDQALSLLGLSAEEVRDDPRGAQYLSGSVAMPGSEPAAHCYCGHQFGQFAGQLGDGAACYLGEVKVPHGQNPELLIENPSGRWEIQVKGSGLTPFSRQADGRKVLRSSIREFLCSEAMFFLGVPTTRAGSVVTSDSMVQRDIYYTGRPRNERCSVVLRIAPTFIRFGSFEIFKQADEFTGRQGPSYGHDELKGQMLDYVIEMFYPDILQNSNRVERNVAFFREVVVRTARLVAQWQCVGFCHGVLNTDNMSILGLTLDYGPYGFMDRFDPEFICNASDSSGRYSYQAQPAVCRWNLAKLAEALAPELPPERAEEIIDEYMDLYNRFYLEIMRKKIGLLKKEEPEDEMLITELLQTMHNTGADFTNTFRTLSQISCPSEGENEEDVISLAARLLLEQCASLEELQTANKATMNPRELTMLLSLAQSNPALFQMISDRATIARQLDKLSKLKDLMETSEEALKAKQTQDWTVWITRYRKRLGRELEGHGDAVQAVQDERVKVMDSTNPRVVLRNYIAQNAIEAAENGDFSEVQRVLKVLEKPFSSQPGLELPTWVGKSGAAEEAEREESEEEAASSSTVRAALPYTSKPPTWAQEICVT